MLESTADDAPRQKTARKENEAKRVEGTDDLGNDAPGDSCLETLAEERKELERFLFEESNKINRPAIKFILEKWASMEARLQSALVENEILKEKVKNVGKLQPEAPIYAQTAAMRARAPRTLGPGVVSERKAPSPKEKGEVVLIKPKSEDKRNNEEIKADVIKGLEKVQKSLKVLNIKQMRRQGLVVEVVDQNDIEAIRFCDLEKLGLVVERPRKIDPSIIIYNIEKEYKVKELKKDRVKKNPEYSSDTEIEEVMSSIKFSHSFKAKDERRVNWIVQLPAKHYIKLINKRGVFLMWRSYGIKEYVNVTRC